MMAQSTINRRLRRLRTERDIRNRIRIRIRTGSAIAIIVERNAAFAVQITAPLFRLCPACDKGVAERR